jgi:hypothetical protein
MPLKKRAKETLYYLLCGRYRTIAVLALIFVIGAVSQAVSVVKEDKELRRFNLLRTGMERAEVVQIIGEPEFKRRVEDWGQLPSEIRAKSPVLTEYGYSVGRYWSSSYLEISGIYLGKDERQIEFLKLRYAIVDTSGRWATGLLVVAGFLILAALIWGLLAILCRKTTHLPLKKRAKETLYYLLCGKYRTIAVLALIVVIWAVSGAVSVVKEDEELRRFNLLRTGMERAEVVQIIGEPEFKRRVEDWDQLPSEIRAKSPVLTEYGYNVGWYWSSSYAEISGIYLGKDERQIEFLKLRYAKVDRSGRWATDLLVVAGFLILAALIWGLLAILCRKTTHPK